MKFEMHFSARQKMNLQKWSCFCAALISAFIQALYLSLCLSVPVPVPVFGLSLFISMVLSLSFFIVYVLNRNEKYYLIANKLDNNNPKEKQISRIVSILSSKMGVASPDVKIVKSTFDEVSLEASLIGFPHENTIFISADLVRVYQNGLTAASLEALVAHELFHLKQQDPFLCFVLNGIKIALYVLGILSLCFSPIGSLSLLQTVATSCVLILGFELFYAGFSRAKESLADLGAVEITQKPRSVVRFIYDNYLQYLYWGKLVLENERASQTHFTALSGEVQASLKLKHRQLTSKTFRRIYHHLEKNACDKVEIAPYVQFKNYCVTWFNSHPTIKERTIICEQSVPSSSPRYRL